MTKRTQLIGRSPRMEQVINLVSRPEFMRILESAYEPERNTFTDRRGGYGGGGGYEYNGYFKITDASEGDAFKVKVADGATGEASTCKVNNIVFSVPAWTSEAITATRLIVLKYTAATKASGETPAADAKVELVLLETLPSDDNLNCYYQIGRAIINRDGSRKIQQDHNAASSNGIAQIYWYNLCDQ